MDETSDEEEGMSTGPARPASRSLGLAGVGSALGASAMGLDPPTTAVPPADHNQDMSVSTLHLYDLHLSQVVHTKLLNHRFS